MKKFSVFVAVFTFMMLSFCTTPLFADNTGAYIGIGGSYAWQDFEVNDDVSETLKALELSTDFGNTSGVNLKIGYHVNEVISFEFDLNHLANFGYKDSIDYNNPSIGKAEATVEADVAITTFMLVGKIAPDFGSEVIKPFVTAGFGIIRSELDIKISGSATSYIPGYEGSLSGSLSGSDSDTSVCFKVGTGVDLFVHENVSVGFELAYIVGAGSLEILNQEIINECKYMNYTMGVAYHF